MDDEFIQRYLGGRSALIAQERRQRFDHAFRQTLSGTAMEAAAIVAEIRRDEQRNLWTTEFEDRLAQEKDVGNIYPGMMFTLAKERIERSKLWKIVRRMPKGALLHAHMDALVEVDWLFDQLLSTPGMHMTSPEALHTETALEGAPISFRYLKSTGSTEHSIWSAQYESSAPVPVTAAADSFPNGGRSGFLEWLRGRCTITRRESLEHHLGPNAIWQKFSSTFAILGSIIFYEPIFRAFVHRMCRQLLDDGIFWADLRAAFVFQYYREGADNPEPDYKEVIRVLGEEIDNFKSSAEGERFWGARMIWTTLRAFNTDDITESRPFSSDTIDLVIDAIIVRVVMSS